MNQPARNVTTHGTCYRYRNGCRCVRCRTANAEQLRRYRRRVAYGQIEPLIDAGPVRNHVRQLMARGLSARQIAELSGVGIRTIGSLLYGNNGRPPSAKVRPCTGRALLAVRPSGLPSAGWISATGTQRRLRALIAIGWSANRLAAELGAASATTCRLTRTGGKVTPAIAGKVRQLYDRLWATPGPSHSARQRAERNGWPPALAWDDETIDDPDAKPAGIGPRPGHRRRDLWQSSEELRRQGLTYDLIAERLGVSKDALLRARERVKAELRCTGRKGA